MSVGGTHTPNSHRAREHKATRRQAHAEGHRKCSPANIAKAYDVPLELVVAKPPKREHRNHGRSGGAKHHLKRRKRVR